MLRGRYRARAESGERHPGHLDDVLAAEFDPEERRRRHASLEIGGRVVRVNTTDFGTIDYVGVLKSIQAGWRDHDGHL